MTTRRRSSRVLRWTAVALALAVVAGAAVVWANRHQTVLRLAPGPEPRTERDLVYVAGSSNPKHRLDVYAPPGARGAAVVHFVHGGYWTKGDKDFLRPITGLYGSIGVALARRGVVTFVQSYRLAPETDIDGILDDVIAAVKFTRANADRFGGDPAKLFLVGHSAGGHLVALVGADPEVASRRGLDPKAIAGFVPISAVWDVADMHTKQDAAFNERVTYRVFGNDPARWERYSPLARVSSGAPPFLVLIGGRDYPYLVPQAERARDALAKVGASPGFRVLPENDHDDMVLRFGATNDDITEAVVGFVTGQR